MPPASNLARKAMPPPPTAAAAAGSAGGAVASPTPAAAVSATPPQLPSRSGPSQPINHRATVAFTSGNPPLPVRTPTPGSSSTLVPSNANGTAGAAPVISPRAPLRAPSPVGGAAAASGDGAPPPLPVRYSISVAGSPLGRPVTISTSSIQTILANAPPKPESDVVEKPLVVEELEFRKPAAVSAAAAASSSSLPSSAATPSTSAGAKKIDKKERKQLEAMSEKLQTQPAAELLSFGLSDDELASDATSVDDKRKKLERQLQEVSQLLQSKQVIRQGLERLLPSQEKERAAWSQTNTQLTDITAAIEHYQHQEARVREQLAHLAHATTTTQRDDEASPADEHGGAGSAAAFDQPEAPSVPSPMHSPSVARYPSTGIDGHEHQDQQQQQQHSSTPLTPIRPPPIGQCRVRFPWVAQAPGEITAAKGEILSVIQNDENSEWVYLASDDGREGFIGRNYIQVLSS